MLTIEVTSGPGEGAGKRAVEAPFTIGRDPLCGFALDDGHLAPEQAQVFEEGGEYFLQDLDGATSPSRVHRGAETIQLRGTQAVALRHGDIVHLGPGSRPVALAISLDDELFADDVPVNATGAMKLADFAGVAAELARDGRTAPRLLAAMQKLARRGVDKREVFEGVAEAVFDLLPRASHVAIALAEADFKTVFGRARRETGAREQIRVPRAVVARVRQLGDALITADTAAALAAADDTITVQRIKSTVAAPLWDGTTIRGVIHAFNLGDGRESEEQFTLDDLSLLVTLAAQAALAIDNASLVERLRVAEEKLRGEVRYLKGREEKRRTPSIVGESAAMLGIFKQIERVKDTDAAVCIIGETGTGKELIASAIHYQSNRRDKLFVAQNCAAIPETLLESELFGHKRGAFTGADRDKQGLFEVADGGTLFLDEIGEMSLGLQAKLLRVLQDRQVRPVGATQAKHVNVRILSATNRSLEKEVEKGAFRQDLYYRLHQYPIRVPPLRERRDDIPELFQHFLRRFSEELKKPEIDILPESMDQLTAYNWPGNIRELENECMRLVIQADPDTYITPDMLAPQIRKVEELLGRVGPERPKGSLKEQMEEIERHLLTEALREHGGNKTRTAETLGITREGLHKKLSKYGM